MRTTVRFSMEVALLLAVASNVSQAQWVTFNDATGTRLIFDPADQSTVTIDDTEEKDMIAADFDKNGFQDAAVVRKVPFSVQGARQDVLFMNESGVLVDRTEQYAPEFLTNHTDARDVIAVDVDNDTWLDLVIANTFSQLPTVYRNLGLDASGAWRGFALESPRVSDIQTSPVKFCAVSAGDVNGDFMLDLFYSNYDGVTGTRDVLQINHGPGCFTDETLAHFPDPSHVTIGSGFGTENRILDLDGDGDNDIARVGADFAFNHFNDGSGSFPLRQQQPGTSPYMFVLDDFNGDTRIDTYMVQDPQDQVNFNLGQNPDGTIQYSTFPLAQSPRTILFGGNAHSVDIDGDSDLDIGVSPVDVDIANCNTGGQFALLQNPGNGQFVDPWPSTSQNIHVEPYDFVFMKINSDNCADIFMGTCGGWKVFIQSGCTGGSGGGKKK